MRLSWTTVGLSLLTTTLGVIGLLNSAHANEIEYLDEKLDETPATPITTNSTQNIDANSTENVNSAQNIDKAASKKEISPSIPLQDKDDTQPAIAHTDRTPSTPSNSTVIPVVPPTESEIRSPQPPLEIDPDQLERYSNNSENASTILPEEQSNPSTDSREDSPDRIDETPSIDRETTLEHSAPEALQIDRPDVAEPEAEITSSSEISPALTADAHTSEPLQILLPESGTTNKRSTSLVIQYPAESQIQVIVNKKPLDPETPTQIEADPNTDRVTQIWYNIPLRSGENTLIVQTEDGLTETIEIAVEEIIARIFVRPAGNPDVRADGRSSVEIAGEVLDEKNNPIERELIVTLTASAGKFVGADQDVDRPGFQVVTEQGLFSARLQSDLEPQRVKIRAAVEGSQLQGLKREDSHLRLPSDSFEPTEAQPIFDEEVEAYPEDIEAYTQVQFITNVRPWLFSGVVNLRVGQRGTDFFGSFRDFLDPNEIDEGVEADFGAAVFGTGQVGEWLFTGAYNSRRSLNEDCEGRVRLFRQDQFCDQQYPVYGDSSSVEYLTPSTDSVYVRFERTSPVEGAEPDYVMWGDYRTPEFSRASQLFTATSRELHGAKANFSIGNLQLTAFYSQDNRGFQRDTIVPNGTSGFYFLSRRNVFPGSEEVFLETEELNRPGTVIERKALRRGPDYEIDYDRGTLLFRRAILSVTANPFGVTTVQRIVTTYQFEESGNTDTVIYAGRLQYNFVQDLNRPIWAAVSYLQEDQGDRDFTLYGADFWVSLGNSGHIVGEVARSAHNSPFLGYVSGYAYRLEAEGVFNSIFRGRAYFKSVDENFSNDATFSFVPGQTRYGAQVVGAVSPTTQLSLSYDHEDNFGVAPLVRTGFTDLFDTTIEARPGSRVDNSLSTIRAGIRQKIGIANLSVEYVNRAREDRISPDSLSGDASQIVSGLSVPLLRTLTFRAQNETNLDSSDALFPSRTIFGLDWDALPGVKLRLAHQFISGGRVPNNSITSLDTIVEHHFTEDTSIRGRYSLLNASSGMTGEGAIGLNHTWRIAPGLRLNLGYERILTNNFVRTAAAQQFEQPFAVGQSAAALGLGSGDSYSIGLEYTDNPDFQVSAKFERRNSTNGNATVWSLAAAGRVTRDLTTLVRYNQAGASDGLLTGLGDTATLRVGLAYRNPNSDKFNALLRYEYRNNPSTIPDTLLLGSGTGSTEHVFGAEVVFAPHWRWELYAKHVFRTSTSFLASDFSNTNTISLSQFRVAYKLNYRWDLAAEARWINQPEAGFSEVGLAAELGYYFTPDLRVAAGYSFGSVDDRDFSGFRSDGGPYFSVALKLNDLLGRFFGGRRLVPKQQQESEIDESLAIEEQLAPSAGLLDLPPNEPPISQEPAPDAIPAVLDLGAATPTADTTPKTGI